MGGRERSIHLASRREESRLRAFGSGWDGIAIRLDSVLFIPEEDSYYIYYTGAGGGRSDKIGLAICPVGDDGYSSATSGRIVRFGNSGDGKRVADAAPVLQPEPAVPYAEQVVSQAAVMRQWDATTNRWDWYMYYSYRGKDGILPGIRLATSHDGKHWTRHFNAADPRGTGQIFRSTPNAYYEWHQVFKLARRMCCASKWVSITASAGGRCSP